MRIIDKIFWLRIKYNMNKNLTCVKMYNKFFSKNLENCFERKYFEYNAKIFEWKS